MKKNVLLIAGKTDYPPIGALYIADALEKASFNVTIFNSNEDNGNLLSTLKATRPLFVGFSAPTARQLVEMADKSEPIKTHTSIPTVWGELHPTFLPEECLSEEYVDYVVKGDGEESIVELAGNLATGNLPEKGIIDGKTVKDLDQYQPSWHQINIEDFLFDDSHSVRGKNASSGEAKRIFYYLASSRGCPFNCTFCVNSGDSKKQWRGHSVEWVREQVLRLKEEYAIDGIGFWDDYFFGNKKRSIDIIEFLRGVDVGFLCEVRAKDLTDNFVAWLKEMGCLQVFVGGEAGSDRVLEMIQKQSTVDDILSAAATTAKYKLPARVSFIYGFPGETIDEMFLTKALIDKLKEYPTISISGPKLLTPYPGSKIYDQALAAGFVVPKDTKEWSNVNRFSNLKYLPWLAKELDANNVSLIDLM